MTGKKLNRRDFLRMGALSAVGAAAAACATPTAQVIEKEVIKEVTKEVEVVREVQVEKEVMVGSNEIRYLTQTWNWEAESGEKKAMRVPSGEKIGARARRSPVDRG